MSNRFWIFKLLVFSHFRVRSSSILSDLGFILLFYCIHGFWSCMSLMATGSWSAMVVFSKSSLLPSTLLLLACWPTLPLLESLFNISSYLQNPRRWVSNFFQIWPGLSIFFLIFNRIINCKYDHVILRNRIPSCNYYILRIFEIFQEYDYTIAWFETMMDQNPNIIGGVNLYFYFPSKLRGTKLFVVASSGSD